MKEIKIEITGVLGAGKTTAARAIAHALFTAGWAVEVVDGGEITLRANQDIADRVASIKVVEY